MLSVVVTFFFKSLKQIEHSVVFSTIDLNFSINSSLIGHFAILYFLYFLTISLELCLQLQLHGIQYLTYARQSRLTTF